MLTIYVNKLLIAAVLGALHFIWQLEGDVWIQFENCLHGEQIDIKGIPLGKKIKLYQHYLCALTAGMNSVNLIFHTTFNFKF